MTLLAAVTLVGFSKVVTFIVMLSVLIVLARARPFHHGAAQRRSRQRVCRRLRAPARRVDQSRAPARSTRCGRCRSAASARWRARTTARPRRSSNATFWPAAIPRSRTFRPSRRGRVWPSCSPGRSQTFLLCYVILLVGALAFGVASDKAQPVVGEVLSGSPAAIAGLRPGDRIVAINNAEIASGKHLVDTIHASLGKRLDLVYERNGTRTEVYVRTVPCPPQVGKKLRLHRLSAGARVRTRRFPERRPPERRGSSSAIANQTFGSLALLVTHFAKYAPEISGVDRHGTGRCHRPGLGLGSVLLSRGDDLVRARTLQPAADSRARRRPRRIHRRRARSRASPVDPEKEAMVHIAGFAALMALMLLVAFHDIARIVSGQGVM